MGFERVLLTHLDGRGLRVTSPSPGSPGHRVYGHGDEVTIRGEGFPGRRSHLTGDLIVTILVEMPTADFMTSLTDEQRLVSLTLCRGFYFSLISVSSPFKVAYPRKGLA